MASVSPTSSYSPDSLAGHYSLKLKTLSDEGFDVELDGDVQVRMLKDAVLAQRGVPIEKQRIIFRGRVLKDEMKLSEYKITPDSVLHLVVRREPAAEARNDEPPQPQQSLPLPFGAPQVMVHSVDISAGQPVPDLNALVSQMLQAAIPNMQPAPSVPPAETDSTGGNQDAQEDSESLWASSTYMSLEQIRNRMSSASLQLVGEGASIREGNDTIPIETVDVQSIVRVGNQAHAIIIQLSERLSSVIDHLQYQSSIIDLNSRRDAQRDIDLLSHSLRDLGGSLSEFGRHLHGVVMDCSPDSFHVTPIARDDQVHRANVQVHIAMDNRSFDGSNPLASMFQHIAEGIQQRQQHHGNQSQQQAPQEQEQSQPRPSQESVPDTNPMTSTVNMFNIIGHPAANNQAPSIASPERQDAARVVHASNPFVQAMLQSMQSIHSPQVQGQQSSQTPSGSSASEPQANSPPMNPLTALFGRFVQPPSHNQQQPAQQQQARSPHLGGAPQNNPFAAIFQMISSTANATGSNAALMSSQQAPLHYPPQSQGNNPQASQIPVDRSNLLSAVQPLLSQLLESTTAETRRNDDGDSASSVPAVFVGFIMSRLQLPEMFGLMNGDWRGIERLRDELRAFTSDLRGGDDSAESRGELSDEFAAALAALADVQDISEDLRPALNWAPEHDQILVDVSFTVVRPFAAELVDLLLEEPRDDTRAELYFSNRLCAICLEMMCAWIDEVKDAFSDGTASVRRLVHMRAIHEFAHAGPQFAMLGGMGASVVTNLVMKSYESHSIAAREAAGGDSWFDLVPENERAQWRGIINDDVIRQRDIPRQRPFSDAYEIGQGSKRRRLLESRQEARSRPLNLHQALRQKIKRALRTILGESTSSQIDDRILDQVAQSQDWSLLVERYGEHLTRRLVQRVTQDPDFEASRFPESAARFSER